MNIKHSFCLFIVATLLVSSCSSPQKLYEKGNYFKAFDAVLKDLKGGKKNRKDILLLNKSFSKMIDVSRDEMYLLTNGYEVNDLRYNLKRHGKVDKRYIEARSYIDDENDVKYGKFDKEKIQLVEDAYLEGKALLTYYNESKNKIDARNAFYHFDLVKEYGIGYDDINQLIFEAKNYAMIIYVVDADLDSDFSYQWDVDRKFDDLEGESGFIKIIYGDNSIDGDCYIELDFSRLDVDESDKESSQNFSDRIIEGYNTVTDTSGNTTKTPIYKEVKGRVTSYQITKRVSWTIDIDILKSTVNCDLRERRFKESVEDKVEIFELFGDERAIPDVYKNQSNDRIADTDDMVDELLEKLYDRIRNHLY